MRYSFIFRHFPPQPPPGTRHKLVILHFFFIDEKGNRHSRHEYSITNNLQRDKNGYYFEIEALHLPHFVIEDPHLYYYFSSGHRNIMNGYEKVTCELFDGRSFKPVTNTFDYDMLRKYGA
jgi:hypothetical protein